MQRTGKENQTQAPPEPSSVNYYLEKLRASPQTAKNTLMVGMLCTMQTSWQVDQRAGQDNLPVTLSDFYPEDFFNLYMLLNALEQEG